MPFLQLILLSALWGMSFIFMRIAVNAFGPILLIQGRIAIGAVFVTLVILTIRKTPNWKNYFKNHYHDFIIIGFMNLAIPFTFFAYGAQSLSASILAIINATAPFFSAIFAWGLLKIPMSKGQWLGLFIGFLGVLTVVVQGFATKTDGGWFAILITLMAPMSYGFCVTYIRYRKITLTPLHLSMGSLWAGSLIMLPLSFAFPETQTILPIHWFSFIALGVFCTGLAYIIFYRLFETIGITGALTVTFIVPLFAAIWGVLFLDEAITMTLIVGGTLILLGVAINNNIINVNFSKVFTRKKK